MRLLLCIAFCALCGTASASLVEFESHHIRVTLDVPAHSATITDSGTVSIRKGWNWFYLSDSAKIQGFTLDGKKTAIRTAAAKDTDQLPSEVRNDLGPVNDPPDASIVMFESRGASTMMYTLAFSAVFKDDVTDIRFSREAVGREVAGTVLEQGAYLSPSSYFYPQGLETLCAFSLSADIPAHWESVSDGDRINSSVAGDRKVQSWENPFKSDGCFLMAAPYISSSMMSDSTEVTCLFFEADTSLAPNYLKATAGYVKMYSELIGPYPFKNFIVAENFFPTGYGMPGWTLLGQSVLRLPFIISTSLGHEVLHNWWGNSVYVDYSRGNWCEGLTVYGADYRYKLNESPSAAKEYRKDILKQYVSYVSQDKDFPIREFASRTSPNTRAIGYGKAMMVFHMIEEEIGTQAFFDAWKLVYRTHLGRQIGWEEWVQAFQTTSGRDLSHVIPQWVDRAGAPVLGAEIVGAVTDSVSGGSRVSLRISQTSETPYRLSVPISVEAASGRLDTTIEIAGAESTVTLNAASGSAITIDPDYHLFRRLYAEEVEPIISAVLGAPQTVFVRGRSDEALAAAFREFAGSIAEDSATVMPESSLADVSANSALVILNPQDLGVYIARQAQITTDSVTVGANSYPRVGHTLVLSGQTADGTRKYWVLLTDDAASLPRLGQLVPHYGKYSYLVFSGTKNIGKGQWEVTHSPLRVVVQ